MIFIKLILYHPQKINIIKWYPRCFLLIFYSVGMERKLCHALVPLPGLHMDTYHWTFFTSLWNISLFFLILIPYQYNKVLLCYNLCWSLFPLSLFPIYVRSLIYTPSYLLYTQTSLLYRQYLYFWLPLSWSRSSSIWDFHFHSYVLTIYVRLYWILELVVFYSLVRRGYIHKVSVQLVQKYFSRVCSTNSISCSERKNWKKGRLKQGSKTKEGK